MNDEISGQRRRTSCLSPRLMKFFSIDAQRKVRAREKGRRRGFSSLKVKARNLINRKFLRQKIDDGQRAKREEKFPSTEWRKTFFEDDKHHKTQQCQKLFISQSLDHREPHLLPEFWNFRGRQSKSSLQRYRGEKNAKGKITLGGNFRGDKADKDKMF